MSRELVASLGTVLLAVSSGCHAGAGFSIGTSASTSTSAGVQPVATTSPVETQGGVNPGASAGGTSAGATAPVGAAPVATAECPNPAAHCLPDGEQLYWALSQPWEKGWKYTELAVQKTPADGAGEAKFFLKRSGKEMSTRFFYTTRPAAANELAVGQRIVMFHDNRKDDVYRAPATRTDALGKRWWTARISSVDPIASAGYVLVSGGYKIGTDAVRLYNGDNSSTVVVGGTEDAQFLKGGHWIVSMTPLKDGGWQYVETAAAIAVPSPATKNEGHFIMLRSGRQGWTPHAWATRPATQADLRTGTRVFMFHDHRSGGLYAAPRTRQEAVTKRWWSGVVTDASDAFKGVVTVAGRYQVAVGAIRVPR